MCAVVAVEQQTEAKIVSALEHIFVNFKGAKFTHKPSSINSRTWKNLYATNIAGHKTLLQKLLLSEWCI